GGIYACHQRTIPGDDPFAAWREGIAVGVEGGLPVHFVHFKSTSERTHNHEAEMLAIVDDARRQGLEVTLSSYPYGSGGGGVRVPGWAEEGGPAEIMRRLKDPVTRKRIVDELNETWTWESYIASVHTEANRWMEGMTMNAIAQRLGITVGEVICKVLED